ncbi:MAG: amidinotransferase [Planctomycetota bacterium]|nr:MAG: amidinotransferase [Planctomycetota bacterium]
MEKDLSGAGEARRGGKGWRAREAAFKEEMKEIWGGWGVSSEFGRLRDVLLHRPGPEIENITDPNGVLWAEVMDPGKARAEHDALAEAYRAGGVQVHYVGNGPLDKPNLHFIRDLMLMTPEGAIVARPASVQRAGEEKFVAEALAGLGVPILMTVHGNGIFEGADAVLAGPGLAFVAEGTRTNRAGAEQVEWALRQAGFSEVVRLHLPYKTVHLDGVLGLVDRDLVLVRARETPLSAVNVLRGRGFRILEVSDDDLYMPGNVVALEPGKLVMPAGNPVTKKRLEDSGCTVIEIDLKEIQKSGGAMHCMTGFLKRDEP